MLKMLLGKLGVGRFKRLECVNLRGFWGGISVFCDNRILKLQVGIGILSLSLYIHITCQIYMCVCVGVFVCVILDREDLLGAGHQGVVEQSIEHQWGYQHTQISQGKEKIIQESHLQSSIFKIHLRPLGKGFTYSWEVLYQGWWVK